MTQMISATEWLVDGMEPNCSRHFAIVYADRHPDGRMEYHIDSTATRELLGYVAIHANGRKAVDFAEYVEGDEVFIDYLLSRVERYADS